MFKTMIIKPRLARSAAFLLAFAVSACVVRPEPLTEQERQERAQFLQEESAKLWTTNKSSFDLYDLMSRALLRNLEIQQGQLAAEVEKITLEEILAEQFPQASVRAQYSQRSNDAGDVNDVTPPDRDILTADITYSWSILGFGQSYLRARQQANNALIIEEERGRIANRIVTDTTVLYLRAATADRHLPEINKILSQIDAKIQEADQFGARNLIDPLQILLFKTRLTELKVNLNSYKAELRSDLIRLSSLAATRPENLRFRHLTPSTNLSVRLPGTTDNLEQEALLNRSELRQAAYRQRNSRLDVYRDVAALLPDLEFALSGNFNSESTLDNNQFGLFSQTVTYDLLGLLRLPSTRKRLKLQEELRRIEDLALAVSIIEQVRLSYAQALISQQALALEKERADLWKQVSDTQTQRSNFDVLEDLNQFEYVIRTLESQIAYEQARTQHYADYLLILRSTGVNFIPSNQTFGSEDALAAALKEHWDRVVRNGGRAGNPARVSPDT
ncbi:TolC family protein [Ruegeria sp.]|uniref:TolC family protein n=1 Tax=Ruegeria sp. TaxID=1879320 RepID=UPI002316BE1A|nr:TolC family protein [Ruegeria sp.]MDA7965364.1 TolC family protein [Ruegeria sp.]